MPLNLLLPFLLALCHRAGWLQWFKKDWATLRWWKSLFLSPEASKEECCGQHGEQQQQQPQPGDRPEGGGKQPTEALTASQSLDARRRSTRRRARQNGSISGDDDREE